MRAHNRYLAALALVLFCSVSPCVQAQDSGSLAVQFTSGVNLPLGSSKEVFSLGGGGELSVAYAMPFARSLFAKAAVDYSLVPTAAEDNLSLISIGAGAGAGVSPLARLNLQVSATAGYGLGVFSGSTGGSAYAEASGLASFLLSPAFGLGAGASYRHYVSRPTPFYQALRINLGALVRIGAGGGKANIDVPVIRFDPVFPVLYKHYDDHPLGSATIRNNEKGTINNVRVSLLVNQYMDGPKLCGIVEEIRRGETVELPLYALFTDAVLGVTEGTKVAATLLISYEYSGREPRFESTETIRMYDRNAMTWDDDRKAAAFVTAKDPEILKFSKGIAGAVREHSSNVADLNFRTGMALFEALGSYGVNYVVDPKTPYAEFSKDGMALDYLQFPVQTMNYKAGDCDDLSICYSAMLESTGIETAFITIPGHIFAAFALATTPDDARSLFLNPDNLIDKDEKSWIPVEITMIRDGFLKAWDRGARQWRENADNGNARFYSIHDAWQEYEPVALAASNISLTAVDSAALMARYAAALNRFVEMEIGERVSQLAQQIAKQDQPSLRNKLGVLYARYGLLDKAEEQFTRAAGRNHLPAIVNLGNILFLNKEYDRALANYERAEREQPDNIKALLGIAMTSYELDNQGTVRRIYRKIQQQDPALAERYSYLVSASEESGRASSAMSAASPMWVVEE